MTTLTCFKAYDIRGKLGTELNEEIVYRIGRAYAQFLQPAKVCVGGDVRETSEELKQALARGLMDSGVDVVDLGLIGTEEIYFATKFHNLDGGIMITASHNPIDYNGLKMVREQSRPISNDTGLQDIRKLAEQAEFPQPVAQGVMTQMDNSPAYIDHLLSYLDTEDLQPMKLVVNAGNGAACDTVNRIETAMQERGIPIEFVKMHNTPDGTFPNGIPNPILSEQQPVTGNAVREHKADMGIAWDGDFDRCFLWDHTGRFIEGYYVVGLLAEAFLVKNPGSRIIHDPRLIWNTQDVCAQHDGTAIQSRTGHAYIKEVMYNEDAVYGGEMSAHHYFRDFAYCDSGMIPWLLVCDLLSKKKQSLSELVSERMTRFPSPGEINSKVDDADVAIQRVFDTFRAEAISIDETDGVSLEFPQWRFNLRKSNTEPVVRLNLETRGDEALMKEKTDAILQVLRG
ncbi:phosphomannomutase CpsG [Natronospirillum operosum]|uniref:phosphomannomutase n=1 Tax=Natronospirillum operosum TaxID=2759953 RepID=A0A4Z0W9I9_9GAMM|nr:phosphomannomutase CpsG [Natronospirillum operosum]TGG95289.1 phosphomannomutase CpsG [Natronospirillum operosum]